MLATLVAAVAQTARNAAQAGLTREIGTLGATQVRFLFGLPFAVIFLGLAAWGMGEAPPALTAGSLGYAALGALAQIGATALMLMTMQSRSFAVTTAWIKTEPVIVALVATVVIGDPLTPAKLVAILVATAGVLILSTRPETARGMLRDAAPVATGLLAGFLFGLAAIGFRGGILALPEGSFLIRASTILVVSLVLQSGVLLVWLLAFDRRALAGSFRVWRASILAGFLGAFASQFWFIGFSLTTAANVRTLALVEVILALGVSALVFRQPVSRRQVVGTAVILLGVGLLLNA
ncbi:DMT family transporter [Tabrizicola sp.]|uniref:DMT family transporter n=1 Tax=Tabrizicola sp. TaxID=2005166 RepID=UPI0025FEF904|nr:DMT family transporter [Tabrizicola sp.]MDK2774552.1 DMT family transporter [Tabrizicola sp.]